MIRLLKRSLLGLLLFTFLFGSVVFGASQLVDVKFTEFVGENVKYNPLQPSSGLYADSGENQSSYTTLGYVNVTNVHPTQSAQNIVLNISGISNINGMTFFSGAQGYVTDYNVASDYVILVVPDLGPGNSSVFNYTLNVSNIAPPLNITASYSDSRIFSGLPINVTDSLENVLNPTFYPENCIYNISVVSNALTLNSSGVLSNVTFDSTSLAGSDSSNASVSADNRTITWNTLGGGCLYSSNVTDLSYLANTPTVTTANNYEIINSTLSYALNGTFSRLNLASISSYLDLDLKFDKSIETVLTGDNATWKVLSSVSNPSDVDVNLTSVSLWVSVRNGTGTGFTNPSIVDNDTISGASLTNTITPNLLLNSSNSPFNTSGSEWFFNYTYSSSPIVWMDLTAPVVSDGLQLQNRSISYGENVIYIKELYLATGYWLQISKNITRLSDNNFNVFIEVINLGNSPTPADQAVQVYNFIPNTFNLTSPFVYSTSTWYTTSEANTTLNDPIYNGTMYQFAILQNNSLKASLDSYGGAKNANNSWSVTYNLTGSGEFNYDDLFLTGVDPLQVDSVGGTSSVLLEGKYSFLGSKSEYILGTLAIVVALLLFFI